MAVQPRLLLQQLTSWSGGVPETEAAGPVIPLTAACPVISTESGNVIGFVCSAECDGRSMACGKGRKEHSSGVGTFRSCSRSRISPIRVDFWTYWKMQLKTLWFFISFRYKKEAAYHNESIASLMGNEASPLRSTINKWSIIRLRISLYF